MGQYVVRPPETATVGDIIRVRGVIAQRAKVDKDPSIADTSIWFTVKDEPGDETVERETTGALGEMMIAELKALLPRLEQPKDLTVREATARAYTRWDRRWKLVNMLKREGWAVPEGLEP